MADLEKTVEQDKAWLSAVFYLQASASQNKATKIVEVLELSNKLASNLMESSSKGLGAVVRTAPLLYRFYEILQVYGMSVKEIIDENFGDGIMSAMDFTLDTEEEDSIAFRVKVIMNDKFLSYKKQ